MEKFHSKIDKILELLVAGKAHQKDFLSVREASEYLDVSESAIHKLTSKREIPHFKPGGKKIYFKKSDLDNWILSGKVETTEDLENEINLYLANPLKRVQL